MGISVNSSWCSIRGIIFDLGNVLISFDHWIAAGKLPGVMRAAPKDVYELFFSSGLAQLFESGKMGPQEFFCRIREMLGLQMEYTEFVPVWNEIFFLTEENKMLYRLACQLKERYKLLLLSNINILHFEYLKNNFPVFDVFHEIITSYEAGMVKPDPLIYRKALETIGFSAKEVFYTDDRPELIKEAESLGIRGFVYKGVDQFKRDLASCGVTI